MKLDESFLNDLARDNLTDQATQMAGGMEPPGAIPMTMGEFATSVADVPAGLLKGAVQGTVGLPGDIESLTYGVKELFNRRADEGALDAFLRGLEQKTILPTTENVKKWLDENVGTLVPAGASERRTEAAKIPEFVGELGGAGKTVIEASKAAGRGLRQVTAPSADLATKTPAMQAGSVKPEAFLPEKLSNKKIGSAFDRMVNEARQDFEEVMFNWQGGVFLNEDANKLITYPGRDQAFSKGKEGGKVVVTKKDMINWLMSDGPFDEAEYGADIKSNQQWVDQIERLRSIVREAK